QLRGRPTNEVPLEDDDMALSDNDIERIVDAMVERPLFRETYLHSKRAHRIVLANLGATKHGRNKYGVPRLHEMHRILRDYLGADGMGREPGGASLLRRVWRRVK